MPVESIQLTIDRLWNGRPAPAHAWVGLSLSGIEDPSRSGLVVEFSAPFHGDRAPPAPAGRFDTLWEYEVVELFVANADGHYTEVEFGPHGHHLGLAFEGERNCVDRALRLEPRISRAGDRWTARCVLPPSCLPQGCDRFNAYAIFGAADSRTYLAHSGRHGAAPDFHALSTFIEFSRLR